MVWLRSATVEGRTSLIEAVIAVAAGSQRLECSNCADDTAMIGILLAGAALVVSTYSLYLGAARRPKIQVDYVPDSQAVSFGSWRDAVAQEAGLKLKLVVANTGASGTYIERFGLSTDYSTKGPSPFDALVPDDGVLVTGGSGSRGVTAPLGFQRGDVKPIELWGKFTMVDGVDSQGLARVLRDFKSVELEVQWTYHRPDLLRPWHRHAMNEALKISVSADHLKRDARRRWGLVDPLGEQAEIRIMDEGR
jgi:hypothetical protein